MMCPKSHRLRKLASAVSKRSGISLQTLEVAIPAIFDEIRHQLAEGDQYVIIESFGTFDVEAGHFDTDRRSFELKVGDPKPRSRAGMLYTKGGPLHLKYARKNRRPADPPEAAPMGEGQNVS